MPPQTVPIPITIHLETSQACQPSNNNRQNFHVESCPPTDARATDATAIDVILRPPDKESSHPSHVQQLPALTLHDSAQRQSANRQSGEVKMAAAELLQGLIADLEGKLCLGEFNCVVWWRGDLAHTAHNVRKGHHPCWVSPSTRALSLTTSCRPTSGTSSGTASRHI